MKTKKEIKDKLIELIGDAPYGLRTLGQAADELISVEGIADHLIANDVTVGDVPDTNVGKWIPVTERLPDANGVYLSVDDMGIYSFRVFDPSKRMWKAIWEDEKVTHWMPLPEPPKENANDTD